MKKKPVKIIETILRDAHQSSDRYKNDYRTDACRSLKRWIRSVIMQLNAGEELRLMRPCSFLKEDPWDRLRKFRDGFKHTKLQMLFRGQNILGYRPYADDVVEYFRREIRGQWNRYYPNI